MFGQIDTSILTNITVDPGSIIKPVNTTTSTGSPSKGSSFLDILNTAWNVVDDFIPLIGGGGVIQQPQGSSSPSPSSGYTQPGSQVVVYSPNIPNIPAGSQGMSTGTKVLIGAGIATGIGLIIIAATAGRKKSRLGEINTAKTKAGRSKQRAAVFADLTESKKLFCKGKRSGKRNKRSGKCNV